MDKDHDDREVLVREFPVEFSAEGDGRTLEARIVPYNTPTRVADPPDYVPYEETWLPGAFEKQQRAADRIKVWLNFEHDGGLRGIVGHGISLEERGDALYGCFRVHENADGDKALQLVRDGLLSGISLEAKALRSRRLNGVVERVRAHLDKVSLCREPAFKEAQVLALREASVDEEPEPVVEPEPEIVVEPDPEFEKAAERAAVLDEALERVGYEPWRKRSADEALEHIGYAPIAVSAITRKPWDGSPVRFEDDEYQRACLIDRGGDAPVKERCVLPVLEPNGELSYAALAYAARKLNQANASEEQKTAAARKLLRYYRLAEMTPPETVTLKARR